MDIFNNIWSAISVPNEGFINIFLIFAAFFIEAPLILYINCNIFNLKPSWKKKLIYILVTAFSSSRSEEHTSELQSH